MNVHAKEDKSLHLKWLKVAGCLLVCLFFWFWGMAVVKWQVPPYGIYIRMKSVLGLPRYLGPDAELTQRFAFVDPLVKPEEQIDPPIQNMKQISERVKKLELDVAKFPNAFSELHVLNGSFRSPNIFSLQFELGRSYTAYAYFDKSYTNSSQTAFLIIPGSGLNQSSEILRGGMPNYHDGLLDVAQKYGDVYTYIKPNEDIRAIHNGQQKLSYDFITNTLISHGGSYSAYYIVETIAITKYLKQKYKRVVVAGVSQGAWAAFLNGIQSWPDFVISVAGLPFPGNNYVFHASPLNIMIPKLNNIVQKDATVHLIRDHPTRWFFTLGKLDIGGFRVFAEENYLSQLFQGIDQVTVKIHNGAHMVPGPLIDEYLNQSLRR